MLARVGSPDYFDDNRAGQVDMTRAVRSPGSTLKPFIYGLAFEDGFVHPETLIDDRPIRFGAYAPENFDLTFQGTVPVRKALQLSLNVPAVALLDQVGASRLSARLKQAGGNLVLPKDEVPGLAMGLGGVGVTLQDLVQLYAGIRAARHHASRLRELMDDSDARDPLRLMDPVAAWQVGNVLIGTPPPENAPTAPHRLQDRHQLRLSRRLVGRLRRPHDHRRLGRTARWRAGSRPGRARRGRADPVRRVCPHRQAAGAAAEGAEGRPDRQQRQAAAAAAPVPPGRGLVRTGSEQAPHIQFPLNGSRIDAAGSGGAQFSAMPVKVAGGVLPMTMMVNGVAAGEIDSRRQRLVDPPGPGFVRLTVIDATGAADTVVVRIQ